MRANAMLPAGLLAAALAAGCGDTLVDSEAEVLVQPSACSSDTSCGDGKRCDDCTTAPGLPPNSVGVCLPQPRAYACGFACQGGLLKCGDACCTATAVASGGRHSCAITSAGGLVCWGLNEWKQVDPDGPVTVLGPRTLYASGVTAVAAGESHTCAVVNGIVQCWGWPQGGQTEPPSPLTGVTALAAGRSHTCALVGASGQVRCWGSNGLRQTAGGTPVDADAIEISAGRDHTCAVLRSGSVRCWGANESAQMGVGTTGASSDPVDPLATRAGHVAAGLTSTCVARTTSQRLSGNVEDGLVCWGAQPGPLFLLASPQLRPEIPRKDADTSVVRDVASSVAAGRTHVCVRRAAAGEGIECFGPENGRFQLGQNTPAIPNGEREALLVAGSLGSLEARGGLSAGADHTCAIWQDGTVHCWGSNEHGQLGLGSNAEQPDAPVAVSGR